MSRLRLIRGAVVLAAVLLLAGAIAFMFAAPPNRAAELERQVEFPAIWTPTEPADGVPWRGAEVTVQAGGEAQLINVPGGQIQHGENTVCVARSENLFTGPATWTGRAEGYIELNYEGGSMVLVPDSGKFGSLGWIDASVPFCGGEPAAIFGLRSAPKLPAG